MNAELLKSVEKAIGEVTHLACDERTARTVVDFLKRDGWTLTRTERNPAASNSAMDRNAKLALRHWNDHDDVGAFGFAVKADVSDPAMQRILGTCYFFGYGTEVDEEKGMDLLSAAAETGDAEAQEILGERYKYGGENIAQDYDMAVKWLTLAAESGNHAAEGELGDMYMEGMVTGDPDVQTALKWLEKAVAGGDGSAAGGLGDVYYYGRDGVAKDLQRALELYEKGRVAGNWNCANMVGWMCENGEGTSADLERALACYRESAENGVEQGEKNLRSLCDRLGRWVNVMDRAVAGDVKAQYELADAYDSGENGLDQNYGAAFKWFERAAAQDDIHAIYRLGLMLWDGCGCVRARTRAVDLWERCAAAGDADALNELGGFVYKDPEFLDPVRAIDCLQAAVDKGNVDATMNLAYEYYSGETVERDLKKAFELYMKAAEKEQIDAVRNIGHMYENGEGTPVNLAEAERWYRRAADMGDERSMEWLPVFLKKRALSDKTELGAKTRPTASKETMLENSRLAKEAFGRNCLSQAFGFAVNASPDDPLVQRILGTCYKQGAGTAVDEVKASACFARASELGDVRSQYELGWAYYAGKGVAQDYAKAREQFELAAQGGDAPSQSMLGYLLLNGIGVGRDVERAVSLFHKAAANGHAKALLHLGCACRDGNGVRQDSRMAEDYFRQVAEKGDPEAYAHLGAMYRDKKYGLYAPAEAFRCLGFAAERGLPNAQFNLANMYETGECVPRDMVKAADWYGKAARQGDAAAQRALRCLGGQDASVLFLADQKDTAPYRAFISYRRVGGREYARNLYLALRCRGIKTFFDYTSLRDGTFNEEILHAIEQAPNVVLMVSDGALDRCADADDWVRRELEYAKKLGKNIIPVAPSGCSRDLSALPDTLADLRNVQVSEMSVEELFEESVEKIIRNRFRK